MGSEAEPVEYSKDEFEDFVQNTAQKAARDEVRTDPEDEIRGIAKNAADEVVADMMGEGYAKSMSDWNELSQKEKRRKFTQAVSGQAPAANDQQVRGRENLWFTKGRNPDPEWGGEPVGTGKRFAAALPFIAKAQLDKGKNWNWRDVAKHARDGIEHPRHKRGIYKLQNKAVAESIDKGLEAGTVQGGGALIPETFAEDFIGFLYDSTVLRQMGARTVEMPNGSIDFGKMNQTATAYWVGEGFSITESQENFGRVKLEGKKLGVLVTMTNDVIRKVPRGLEQIVTDDMSMVAQLEEDLTGIRGTGGGASPTGIRNMVDSGQRFDSAGDTTANIIEDSAKAIYLVERENIPMNSTGWIMQSRTHTYLQQLRDSNDNLVSFAEMLAQGQWFGHDVYVTNQIPRDLDASGTGGNDETEMYFGDASQLLVGESLNLEVESFDSGTVGNTNLITDDSQALRLTHEVDFQLRHDKAFSVIEAQSIGASFDS